ncbi:hypothetical protein IKQ65_02225 [Candidatus Saccharibacteria bacterium]|nr:hypothetical protein [Candidatus Saccharibacteria bacterium]
MTIEYRDSIFGTVDIRLKGGHCEANCAVGKDYFTVLLIHTHEQYQGKGEAQRLLLELRKRAEENGQTFRVWAPLTHTMIHICQKLDIKTCDLEGVLKDAKTNGSATTSAGR